VNDNRGLNKTIRDQRFPDDENFSNDLIRGLDFLIAEAKRLNMKVPARIIRNARSDIVHWAVNSDLSDNTEEELLKQAIDHDGFLLAIDFVAKYAAVKDTKLKEQILSSLEQIKRARNFSSKSDHAEEQ